MEAFPSGATVYEDTDGKIFYEAVVVKSETLQTYRVQDCVQLKMTNDDNDDEDNDDDIDQVEFDFCQITAIFEDPYEQNKELGIMLEVRWFSRPEEVRLVKTKKIEMLPNELIESCKLDNVPPGAIMKIIHVTDADVSPELSGNAKHLPAAKRPRHNSSSGVSSSSSYLCTEKEKKEEKEGDGGVIYPCRYLLSEQEDTLLPISVRAMWQRSTQYSEYAHYYDEYTASHGGSSLTGEGGGSGGGGGAQDPFSKAVAQLHISVLPAALPCREDEQRKVFQFLKSAMTEGGRKRPLYISGMPGTGKTATVHAAVKALQKEQAEEVVGGTKVNNGKSSSSSSSSLSSPIPTFEFIEINGLRISSPQEAYTVLWRGLSGEYIGPQVALDRLKGYFKNLAVLANAPSDAQQKTNKPTNYIVCLLDELDYMVTKNESIVYNFFDWPQQQNSGLIVIGIANTMDLPERLNKRSLSRMGGQTLMRIAFKAYTHEQINGILADRLQHLEGVFDAKSLQLTARKAASTAGDLRSALKICQRAIELHRDNQLALLKKNPHAESPKKFPSVTMAMVSLAAAEYKENPLMIATGAACNLDKAIFIGMCRCNNSTGVEEMTVEEIWNRTCDVIHDHGRVAAGGGLDAPPPWAVFDWALDRLVQSGMLNVLAGGGGGGGRQGASRVFTYSTHTMLAPRLPHNDIIAALRDADDPMAAAVWGTNNKNK